MLTDVRHWLAESEATFYDRIEALRRAVLEELGGETEKRWIWVRDASDEWVVFEDSGSGSPAPGLYKVGYVLDNETVQLAWPAVEVEARTTYVEVNAAGVPKPVPTDPAYDNPVVEAAEFVGDYVELVEASVRADGTVPIKIMAEGWGSSGYYPREVIERDGPAVFARGTHAYWDHPTVSEAAERPERSLRDLAGTLAGPAYWSEDGAAGPGLYGDVFVFETYRGPVDELGPHIGMSIRGKGQGHFGEVDGKRGLIIDRIVEGLSVDFVTAPGAGGKVLSLFESARGFGPRPVPATTTTPEGDQMKLEEIQMKLTEAEALGAWAAAERDQARADLGRERTARLLREAADHVALALVEAKLPDVAKQRIIAETCSNPPATTAGDLDRERLNVAVAESARQMAELIGAVAPTAAGGTVVGLGESAGTTTPGGIDLEAEFRRLGLSEAGAKHAIAGR